MRRTGFSRASEVKVADTTAIRPNSVNNKESVREDDGEKGDKWMQGVGGDGDIELEAEEVVEGRGVRKMLDPRLPSELEVKEHQLTHLPLS